MKHKGFIFQIALLVAAVILALADHEVFAGAFVILLILSLVE